MRAFCVVLFSFLILSPAFGNTPGIIDTFESYLIAGYEQVSHGFGAVELYREAESIYESVVYWPQGGFLSEANHIIDAYISIMQSLTHPDKYNFSQIISCNPGAKSDYFKFLPHLVDSATINKTFEFSSPCFEANTMTLTQIDDQTVEIEHIASNASSKLCSDVFFYATTQNYHLANVFFHGTHKTRFSGLTTSQMKEIQRTGIQIFRICDSFSNIFPDIVKTILLFAGGITANPNLPFIGSHPTFWMEQLNVDFINHATGYQWQKRKNTTRIDLDPSYIHSGDFFAVTRMDGLDQIIEWGAGSHAGHSVVALWVEGELYFAESQAAWYWPRTDIQMNPYKTWLEWADNAGYSVTHLPLKEEYRKIFNETAAYEWFKTVEGVPYGFHNFLFGWVDTEHESYPSVISPEIAPPVLSILEKFIPAVAMIFNEAINFRMNTTNLSISDLAEIVYEKNLTWGQVFAMPEQDQWVYTDGYNMVCSSFVVGIWRAAGLFGDLEIQVTEFTPRDAYSMIFIDPNPELPQVCKDVDPENPFCQIMGKYKMEFPQISTVAPYAHMNERCPSLASNNFTRVEGC